MNILNSQENDGVGLIIEPGYTWSELRENVMNSCLKKKCHIILDGDRKTEEVWHIYYSVVCVSQKCYCRSIKKYWIC